MYVELRRKVAAGVGVDSGGGGGDEVGGDGGGDDEHAVPMAVPRGASPGQRGVYFIFSKGLSAAIPVAPSHV